MSLEAYGDDYPRSRSSRARGLKRHHAEIDQRRQHVALFTGAWIETTACTRFRRAILSRSSRARGLKRLTHRYDHWLNVRRALHGRADELWVCHRSIEIKWVAPLPHPFSPNPSAADGPGGPCSLHLPAATPPLMRPARSAMLHFVLRAPRRPQRGPDFCMRGHARNSAARPLDIP